MPGYYDRMPHDFSGQQSYRDVSLHGYGSSADGNRLRNIEGYGSNSSSYGGSGYQARPPYSGGTGYGSGQGQGSSQSSYMAGSSSMGGSSSYGSVGSRYDSGSTSYGSSSYDAPSGHGGAAYRSGVTPWQGSMSASSGRNVQEGILPTPRSSNMGGYMHQSGGGRSGSIDVVGAVSQLQQMGNPESKIALNIISAVLGKSEESSGGDWNGPPPSKMRHMDWGEGHGMRREQTLSSAMQSPPMRKYPQQGEYHPQRVWDSEPPQLAMASRPFTSGGQPRMGNDQNRRMARGRRGNRNVNDNRRKFPRDQSRGRRETTATGNTSAVQKGKISGSKESSGSGADRSRTTGGHAAGSAPKTPHVDIPKEALVCHMCNLSGFNTVGGYIRHLQTREHIDSAAAFQNQSVAVLELLRCEAKLVAKREILKSKKGRGDQRLKICAKCKCRVAGTLEDHYRSVEHVLVNQAMRVKCCGKNFSVRGELDMHRLSLEHLKVQYDLKKELNEELKKFEEAEKGMDESENEDLMMFKTAADEYKARKNMEEFTVDTLPPYDPSKPVGLHLIGIRSHYRCKVCPSKMRLETDIQILRHYRSIEHYHNLFDFVVNQQMEKRKKKIDKTLQKATVNKSADETKVDDKETNEKSDDSADKNEENGDTKDADALKEGADISKDEEKAESLKEEDDEADLEAIGEDIAVDIGEDIELLEDPTVEQEETENVEEEAMDAEEQSDEEKEPGESDEEGDQGEAKDSDDELDYEGYEEEEHNSDEAGEKDEEEQEGQEEVEQEQEECSEEQKEVEES